jgi:hypothetical protein
MKKITFLMAAMFLSVAANAQLVDVVEDFEAGIPAGWSTAVNSGSCDWMLVDASYTVNAFSLGSAGMIFDDDACGGANTDNNATLLSDVYDVSNADGTLDWSYDYYYDDIGDATVTDFLTHEASVDGGATWIEIETYADADVALTNAVFTNPVTPGTFPTIQFRWTYDDGADWSWSGGIDNFAFSYTNLLGVSDDTVEGFSFAPNPAQDVLNLNAQTNIERATIVNILGQTVIDAEINATSSTLDVSSLAAGTYILKVAVGDETGTYHIIKE